MAFSGCSSLTKLDIPNSCLEIKTSAFRHCRSLEYIKLPKSMTIIHDSTF
eukprot:CAMPEP_0172444468 /NCGR_PEP_ID=MMETSP1065-20121228/4507_1 /TAXON_ID=265537 /ORGANISM="Amphiprora paludosa, Strain CCMP125" /LENGTH=49 /DNA_ID= /DNA_START= /DNA_END= /DNA_ORIENTATION=